MSTEITITIGGQSYRGRLPHMRHRFSLHSAWLRALGIRPGDETDPTTGYLRPSAPPDADSLSAVALAAIGLCWDDRALTVPAYLPVRRALIERGMDEDEALIEYGLHVEDVFIGHDGRALWAAGKALLDAVHASIPTKQEVEDAMVPFVARAAGSTGST